MPLSASHTFAVWSSPVAEEEKNGQRRFAPKSIANYVQVIQMVVGSALSDKGEAIYPVKWNHNFMDLPEVGEQKKPAFTAAEVTTIVSKAEEPFRTLYALLAGTGLRIEEAIGLQVQDVRGRVTHVRHSHWNGELYDPKTTAGIREVDLHSSLVSVLRERIALARRGFSFRAREGHRLRAPMSCEEAFTKSCGRWVGRNRVSMGSDATASLT
jgi:integrase